jgi:hypothetical protein
VCELDANKYSLKRYTTIGAGKIAVIVLESVDS